MAPGNYREYSSVINACIYGMGYGRWTLDYVFENTNLIIVLNNINNRSLKYLKFIQNIMNPIFGSIELFGRAGDAPPPLRGWTRRGGDCGR